MQLPRKSAHPPLPPLLPLPRPLPPLPPHAHKCCHRSQRGIASSTATSGATTPTPTAAKAPTTRTRLDLPRICTESPHIPHRPCISSASNAGLLPAGHQILRLLTTSHPCLHYLANSRLQAFPFCACVVHKLTRHPHLQIVDQLTRLQARTWSRCCPTLPPLVSPLRLPLGS